MTNDRSPEELIPAVRIRAALGDISAMTLWRWRRDKTIPEPVKINGRLYWKRSVIFPWIDDLGPGMTSRTTMNAR